MPSELIGWFDETSEPNLWFDDLALPESWFTIMAVVLARRVLFATFPQQTGCSHVHLTLRDENAVDELRAYHMTDFTAAEDTQGGDLDFKQLKEAYQQEEAVLGRALARAEMVRLSNRIVTREGF